MKKVILLLILGLVLMVSFASAMHSYHRYDRCYGYYCGGYDYYRPRPYYVNVQSSSLLHYENSFSYQVRGYGVPYSNSRYYGGGDYSGSFYMPPYIPNRFRWY